MSVAVLTSMAIWLSDSRKLYYGIGIIELSLIVIALITAIIFKASPVTDDEEASDEDGDDSDDESDEDDDDSDEDNDSDDDDNDGDEAEDDEDEATVLNAANTVNNLLNM
jgi:ABC-type Zn2+ transport system substrate-binding protein/surface adhesin